MSCPNVFVIGVSIGSIGMLLIIAGILFGSLIVEKRAQRNRQMASRVDTPERWSDHI